VVQHLQCILLPILPPNNYFYDDEDDTMHELGKEFGEDLENAEFHLEQDDG
jgi:hypothetical protein